MLLSFDPGLNDPAIALFKDKTLIWASRVHTDPVWAGLNMGERIRQVALACATEAVKMAAELDVTAICSEWPQAYSAGKSKTSPNTLMPMCGIVGALAGYLAVPLTTYLPREWLSGQCPKKTAGNAWKNPRGRRVKDCLTQAEVNVVVLSHDAVDAIGIGLHHLGRFTVRRVFPGAT